MLHCDRRTFITASGIALLTGFAGCSSDDGEDGPGENEQWLSSDSFEPLVLTVEVGTEVTWINQDGSSHELTSAQLTDEGEEWDFHAILSANDEQSHTFEEPGIYQLYSDTPYTDETTTCGAIIVNEEGEELSLNESLPCEE